MFISDAAVDSILRSLPAIGGVIATVITSLTAAIASIMSLKQSRINSTKADELADTAEKIHTLTNGNVQSTNNALAVANETIKGLREVVGAHEAAIASMTSVGLQGPTGPLGPPGTSALAYKP